VANTAILSALAQEQQGLLAQLQDLRQVRRAGRDFWLGNLHGQPVVLGLSRIGKVAAATTATVMIEAFAAERVVFTGVAGALGNEVHVGDVVIATEFVQHHIYASPLFPRFEIPLYRKSLFACDAQLSALLATASHAALRAMDAATANPSLRLPIMHQGPIASGDRFVSTAQASTALLHRLADAGISPLAVEMEGAAVAQVCHDYGVPFAAVRTISDRADEQASADFQHFVTHVASRYALRIMDQLLRALQTT
jgi:adenosylhomocysteine nucleosidase